MACATRLCFCLILIQLYSVAASNSHAHGNGHGNATTSSCHPDQAAALLQLKQSFIFDYSTTTLPSWQPGTDCCLWEGVGCEDGVFHGRHVTVLDISGHGLYSYGCHAALFNLTSLHYLDLSMNDFGGSRIPAAGFEKLSNLTHLNLSNSGFYGQIPVTIGKLTSLISLDFSFHDMIFLTQYGLLGSKNYLLLRGSSFETLVANLTNLRELYLDGVDISESGADWCTGLGKAVPHLQVLSMAGCQLDGPIHSSLSNLRSLTMINLEYNHGISGAIPEFFADFLSLSVLQLSSNSFSGWFPRTIFQLKNIRVLDVSGNSDLSGHLPKIPKETSLETLYLDYTNFSCIKLSSLSNLPSLRGLGFDGGSISMEPTDLPFPMLNSLQNLQLSFARFSGELGSFFLWIRSLQNLKSLQLSYCYSSKIMATMIGNLTNLTRLEITLWASGQIPPSIGNLTKLTSLRISDCVFSGPIPSSIGNLKKLRSLEITNIGSSGFITKNTGLSGQIPTDIGFLSRLKVLKLAGCILSGGIPSTISNLTQLMHVDLSRNNLGGEIPTSLFSSLAMLQLDLSYNQFFGPIQEFGELTNLMFLDLSSNKLTGSVKLSSVWKLRRLTYLGLSDNRLFVLDGEGSIPLLPKILSLGLASCNLTTIPRFLMHVNHISTLDISSNKIHGTIPKWIWETWEDSLIHLNLSHNIFTYMQLTSYVLPTSRLESLDLSSNRLQGQIPMPAVSSSPRVRDPSFQKSQLFDYSNNRFSSLLSNFTACLSNTTYLKLSNNNLSGHIPHSICNPDKLQVLDVSYNNFSGLIPSCLLENSHLGILNLRGNHFEGTLPYYVTKHCHLETIDLHGNRIQGQLPRSLSNCGYLEILDIGNNQIIDTFPSWLANLSNLHVLVLRSNQFYGSVSYVPGDSKFGEHFSNLQIIDIASNNFSGSLDPRWFERLTSMMAKSNDAGSRQWFGNPVFYDSNYYHDTATITYKGQYMAFEKVLLILTAIDFSNNAFDGDIPESVGRLVSLYVLNMSYNAFTGRIPAQMGEMRQLESLDLSWNKLSGEIPQELADLTFLGVLNFSENKLEGRIPQSRQFATFENNSYEGNAGLCGPPLSKPCGGSSNPNEAPLNTSGNHVDIILFLFIGVGFGVGFTAGILMKWGKIGKWLQTA